MSKIAITVNSSWNLYNYRLDLIKKLKNEGYEIVCFTNKDDGFKKLVKLNLCVIPLDNMNRKGTNPIIDLLLIRELYKKYKFYDIDIALHFTIKPNIYGSIASSQIGIPSISVVTGLGYTFLSRGLASFVSKKLYKFAFQRNNITIFQNPDDRQLFLDKSLVSASNSIVIYGSGIDTDNFNSNSSFRKTNRILFVGRLLKDKGIYELLQAFEEFNLEFPHVCLDIVGDIDKGNPASLKEIEISKIHSNSIIFHGFKTDVRPYIDVADVVILPSYREGLPRTMLEALSMSKPIITTNVPGCREVIKDGINGYQIYARNSESLLDALKRFYLLTNNEIKEMGKKSRKLAINKFDSKLINSEYVKIIKNII